MSPEYVIENDYVIVNYTLDNGKDLDMVFRYNESMSEEFILSIINKRIEILKQENG